MHKHKKIIGHIAFATLYSFLCLYLLVGAYAIYTFPREDSLAGYATLALIPLLGLLGIVSLVSTWLRAFLKDDDFSRYGNTVYSVWRGSFICVMAYFILVSAIKLYFLYAV